MLHPNMASIDTTIMQHSRLKNMDKKKIFEIFIVCLFVLNLLDFVTTLIGISIGASESNMVMKTLFDLNWVYPFMAKLISTLFIGGMLIIAMHYLEKFKSELGIVLLICLSFFLNIIIAITVLHNCIVILSLLPEAIL